jgi:hypothetical protein
MAKTIITRVGDPDNPQIKPNGTADAGIVTRKDGTSFRWFQVEVVQKEEGTRTVALRNFIDDGKTVDREDLAELMANGTNLTKWQLAKVSIHPIPTPFTDADGNPRMQTSATIMILPTEDLRTALRATNRDFVLATDPVASDAPAVPADVPVDELADAAL